MTTLRRRLVGLAAVVGILVIIVGLPVVLFAVGANPFEAGVPSWSDFTTALTSPDDGSLAVAAIKLVAWLAWALLTLSLLVEIGAKMRGVRAPRMPGLKAPQAAARGLVGAAVMLFVAIPAANVANAAPGSAGPAHAAEPIAVQTIAQPAAATVADDTDKHTAATSADDRARTSEDAAKKAAPKTVTYTVQQGAWRLCSTLEILRIKILRASIPHENQLRVVDDVAAWGSMVGGHNGSRSNLAESIQLLGWVSVSV